MVTFRKSFLLVALIAMIATAASAQVGVTPAFQCVANAGVPPIVRAEGLAELVGDVILNCTGGTPTAGGSFVPKVNFRVFLNTNVTSRLLDNPWNEALLMIDDPAPAAQTICTEADGCEAIGAGAEPGVDYSNIASVPDPPGPVGTNFGQTEANVWQGRFVTGNTVSEGNTVEWLGVPVDPPGTQSVRIIRITNIRANAAQRGVGGGLIPSQLIIFLSATGTTSIPINNPQQVVAFVQDGLNFSAGGASFLQCEEPGTGNITSTTFSPQPTVGDFPSGGGFDIIRLTYTERFATAFKRRNVATSEGSPGAISPQNAPGAIFNTETGFYNPAFSSAHDADEAGLASQGTRLLAQFKNVPSGVSLYVSDQNILTTDNNAQLVTAGSPGVHDGSVSFVQITVSGGSATATWEILGDNPLSNDAVNVAVRVDYTPNTQAGIPELGSAAVAGSYGPLSDIIVATSADLQPRFIDDSEDMDIFTINSCATNLLWPYVTNQAGFDSGLVISNTSRDPFGTTHQEGACEIHYFGNSNGSDPPPMDTTPEIDAGGYAIWTLSSGGGVKPFASPLEGSIAAAPGFEGYVIAHCLFQYGHGYGFISDLGAQRLAQGYLALVMDGAISTLPRTNTRSEPLDQ